MDRLIRLLVIFLVRKRLGLKTYEGFQFINQASKTNWYMFTNSELLKITYNNTYIRQSSVSINWLLDNRCAIKKMPVNDEIKCVKRRVLWRSGE